MTRRERYHGGAVGRGLWPGLALVSLALGTLCGLGCGLGDTSARKQPSAEHIDDDPDAAIDGEEREEYYWGDYGRDPHIASPGGQSPGPELVPGTEPGSGPSTNPTPSGTQNQLPLPTCKGGTWAGSAGNLSAGFGLREPPNASLVYGAELRNGRIVLPACPAAGRIKLPVLLVDWVDYNPATDLSQPSNPKSTFGPTYRRKTPGDLAAYINGESGPRRYFRDVSGNTLDVELVTFGWMSSGRVGSYLKGRGNYIVRGGSNGDTCSSTALFQDALRDAIAFEGLDLRQFDADKNGVLDGAILLYEGGPGLCAGTNLSTVSVTYNRNASPPTIALPDARALVPSSDPNAQRFQSQNVRYYLYTNMPEYVTGRLSDDALTGVWAHELGHLLMGYRDYYTAPFELGPWALSVGGPQPGHPAAWEKWLFARWLAPFEVTKSGTVTLVTHDIAEGGRYVKTTPYAYVVPLDGKGRNSSHLLFVENRHFLNSKWAGETDELVANESGLAIFELHLDVVASSKSPPQIRQHFPSRSPGMLTKENLAFRQGDRLEVCGAGRCVTVEARSAPSPRMQVELTLRDK